MLVETDTPYLSPVPHRGKPCEPAYVVETAKKLAEVKGTDLETVAAATTANFDRLFVKEGVVGAGLVPALPGRPQGPPLRRFST